MGAKRYNDLAKLQTPKDDESRLFSKGKKQAKRNERKRLKANVAKADKAWLACKVKPKDEMDYFMVSKV